MAPLLLPHRIRITSSTSLVQLEHSEKGPSPKPCENWTRFVLISDTHTSTFPVPDGDVLLHAGDLTDFGTLNEFKAVMEWLYALPHPIKMHAVLSLQIIAGNHDYALDREWYLNHWQELKFHRGFEEPQSDAGIRELFQGQRAIDSGIVYLQNEEYKFRVRKGDREWSVYGSPCTPVPGGWGFGYQPADGEPLVSTFPKADILMTHGPPHNVLDATNRGENVGCPALATRIQELKPRLHVFGHIHESRGAYVHLWNGNSGQPNAQNGVQSKDAKISFWDKFKARSLLGKLQTSRSDLQETIADDSREQTLFVNAANSPTGLRFRGGVRVKAGEESFQPIIVDLKE
ncbi:Metallo-dependent phosphatase-like protein [Mycena galopus ATCC 62051]|nr:Metallo-dependent phosphatase-like protein [Mycena galopus ATCC 62051]